MSPVTGETIRACARTSREALQKLRLEIVREAGLRGWTVTRTKGST
jgi:hypothetical protein